MHAALVQGVGTTSAACGRDLHVLQHLLGVDHSLLHARGPGDLHPEVALLYFGRRGRTSHWAAKLIARPIRIWPLASLHLSLSLSLTPSLSFILGCVPKAATSTKGSCSYRGVRTRGLGSEKPGSPPKSSLHKIGRRERTPHPQDKIQHLDFTKHPRPLYYKTFFGAFYHKNVCSKAVFGP